MGVFEAQSWGWVETTLEDHSPYTFSLIFTYFFLYKKEKKQGMVGRLAGAAAFKRVTKAHKGFLITDGQGDQSVRA